MSPALYKNLGFNVLADFEPVILTSVVPLLLSVNTALPVSNIGEFIALLRQNPDKYAYGSAGLGNITHLGSFLFLQELGLKATHVPYKGAGPALVDLIGGQVHVIFDNLPSSIEYIRGGKLRALGTTYLVRAPRAVQGQRALGRGNRGR